MLGTGSYLEELSGNQIMSEYHAGGISFRDGIAVALVWMEGDRGPAARRLSTA